MNPLPSISLFSLLVSFLTLRLSGRKFKKNPLLGVGSRGSTFPSKIFLSFDKNWSSMILSG
jgi:hypothetical protein